VLATLGATSGSPKHKPPHPGTVPVGDDEGGAEGRDQSGVAARETERVLEEQWVGERVLGRSGAFGRCA